MTNFERDWYEKFMRNMVTVETLRKLAAAGKLDAETIDAWAAERMEKYGV